MVLAQSEDLPLAAPMAMFTLCLQVKLLPPLPTTTRQREYHNYHG